MDATVWRWFPVALIAALGFVFAVNGFMIYDALETFPGQAGQDGFDLSNGYQRVLATAQQEAALGWKVQADVTSAHVPVLDVTDRNGAPIGAATIEARAERPVGPAGTTTLLFQPVGGARFQADKSLFLGQWDIMLTVRADGQMYSATRRVVVK
jgi:nitrogen fixation protein FixH